MLKFDYTSCDDPGRFKAALDRALKKTTIDNMMCGSTYLVEYLIRSHNTECLTRIDDFGAYAYTQAQIMLTVAIERSMTAETPRQKDEWAVVIEKFRTVYENSGASNNLYMADLDNITKQYEETEWA